MENYATVKIVTDKTYFMEENIIIHFKFIKKVKRLVFIKSLIINLILKA